jgi:hypothetical protein
MRIITALALVLLALPFALGSALAVAGVTILATLRTAVEVLSQPPRK